MLSRVIAKNVGDVFFETQCTAELSRIQKIEQNVTGTSDKSETNEWNVMYQ